MKAGWVDVKYIANKPQHLRPPNSRHRLEPVMHFGIIRG